MRQNRTRLRWAIPLAVVALAAMLRLWDLSTPPTMVWDEHYYVFDAEAYLGGGIGQPIPGAPAVKIADEGTWVHPPLGKWIIALLGVGPLGDRAFGWRLPAALAGIAGVGVLYLLALQLWGSVWWAGLAGLLLALDGLHIVHSRLATLDIFVTTFITAGMLLVVLDRRAIERGRSQESRGRLERVFGSPYRLGAGLALGAAVATKWSGAFALLFAILLTTVWAVPRDRRAGRSVPAIAGTVVASLVVVPLAVYLISYGAFFYQHGFAVRGFLTLQMRMFEYQRHHNGIQPQNSAPITWPVLLHPIQYFGQASAGRLTRIVALGNPVVWWGFLLLLPVACVGVIRSPRWQDAVAFGGYLTMYLPWLYIGRSQFLYYMVPAVPFMCLAIPAALRKLPPRVARGLGAGTGGLAVVAAAIFLPVWIGIGVPPSYVEHLRWLGTWRF